MCDSVVSGRSPLPCRPIIINTVNNIHIHCPLKPLPPQPTAVRHHKSVKFPGSSEQVRQQLSVGTGRHTVDGIVAAHVRLGSSLTTGLERRLEGLNPITVAHYSIKTASADGDVFRACVHIKVLAGSLRIKDDMSHMT